MTEVLTLYFEKLGTLINTSLFFLVMGVADHRPCQSCHALWERPREIGGPVMRPRVGLAAILAALLQTTLIAAIIANRTVQMATDVKS